MKTTADKAKMITCSRCKGTGTYSNTCPVLCNGVPGGCFKCYTRGVVPNRAKALLIALDEAVAEVQRRWDAVEETKRINAESITALRARDAAKGRALRDLTKRLARFEAEVTRKVDAARLWEAKLVAAQSKITL